MKKRIWCILAIFAALCLLSACEKEPEKLSDVKFDSFAVGFGAADITPDPEWLVNIEGNSDVTSRFGDSVLEPLGATCAAFTDTDGTTVIVFGADLHGADDKVVKAIREGIEEKTGVPANYVQFNTSHNHTGPAMLLTAIPAVQKSNDRIVQRCIQAAVDAMESRAPATMEMTLTRPENLVFLRHYLAEDGTYVGKDAANYKGTLIGHMEPGDNLMQLVRFKREGKRDILLVNFQGHYRGNGEGHPERYTMLSGDYTAVMRRKISEEANTDTVFIFGASGDSAASTVFNEERRSKDSIEHGQLMAQEALAVFDTFTPAQTGKIFYTENKVTFEGQDKQWLLYSFGFGDFGYVAEPFETFQTDGIIVREASPYKMTFYASVSNANNHSGYVPDEKALTYNCYERGPQFTPEGTGTVIRNTLLEMLTKNFADSGQTMKKKLEGYYTDWTPISDGITYQNPTPGDMS